MRAPSRRIHIHLIIIHLITAGDVFLAYGVVHIGLDTAWRDAVDRDAFVAGVDGHAAREGLDGAFGAGVDGVFGDAFGLTGNGSHEDDAAADFEVFVRLSRNKELTTCINIEYAVEFLGSDVLDVAKGYNTGV